MKFSLSSIFSAGLLLASTVAALPPSTHPGVSANPAAGIFRQVEATSNFAKDALERAKALGVDPTGPMPDDFDSFDGKAHRFSEGSKFAAWVAAQTDETALARRQSGISVAAWTSSLCSGSGILWSNIPFETQFYDGFTAFSLQVVAGVIAPSELFLLTDVCAIDLGESVSGGPGCAEFLPAFDCFDFFF